MDPDAVIRPTARAVIRKEELILVQVKVSAAGQKYLTLPGGRQEFGETMHDCLQRECEEEIGVVPSISGVLHMCDVFRTRRDRTRHLVEVLFDCTVPETYTPRMGQKPDKRQVATVWADPMELGQQFLPRYDLALTNPKAPLYLGRLNSVIP